MKTALIKFGTSSLLGTNGKLSQEVFGEIARQIILIMKIGLRVVIVTSGAVQAGREEIEKYNLGCSAWHKKDFAAPGACRLIQMWRQAFHKYDCAVGQILLTHENMENMGERASIKLAINNLMCAGVVPIINENDVVSDREILNMEKKISENDQLTYLLSDIINSDVVISVTSVGGVYDTFPITNKSKIYSELDANNLPTNITYCEGKTTEGSGGMSRKIIELSKCCRSDRRVGIIGWCDSGIIRFVNGEMTGTRLIKIHLSDG